ncbi:uncharacterized protein LOC108863017 [Raphanus sativus]|uniref:Uncharacterized protein LOC108863017 n=1 Tax=Raphanus sativus TaxID=3726 RepID=A0A9W3DQZ5_RAPSA|nr:uncharacterized protein LOC108863017 [Raphanus sativus]XP_056866332.1 uncharacterized protein LOC108863017 [Raphanus sativus]
MRSAYSTTKGLFIFLLVVVEASLCLSFEKEDHSGNEIVEPLKDIMEASRRGVLLWRRQMIMPQRRPKELRNRVKLNNLAPRVGPQVIVDIRWDKTNESDGSYSANVTISNYFKDSELIRRWRLAWLWGSKETLLSTLGVKGTQHGSVFLGEDDYAYCLNNVTFAGDNCIDGVVPLRLRKADIIARRSTSFQITVSYSDRGEHAPPDVGLEYEHECDGWDIGYEHECDKWEIGYEYEHEFDTGEGATNDRNTWRTTCILSIAEANKFDEIHEEL